MIVLATPRQSCLLDTGDLVVYVNLESFRLFPNQCCSYNGTDSEVRVEVDMV